MSVDHPVFRRRDGRPFRIAIRGDCCSRRTVAMNPSLFPDGVDVISNEKCPTTVYIDALSGVTATAEIGERVCNTSDMPETLRRFFLSQFNRTVLAATDIDLLLIDCYADMNFGLWQHRDENYKLWIHPKYLRNAGLFKKEYHDCGKVSFDEAAAANYALIDHIRAANPAVPVLYLHQPVEYYPKLSDRTGFYAMGRELAARRDAVYSASTFPASELTAVDMGSCGPGNTLHFDAATYRKMAVDAWSKGLKAHFTAPGNSAVAAEAGPTGERTVAQPPVKAARAKHRSDDPGIPRVAIHFRGADAGCFDQCARQVLAAQKAFTGYFTQPEIADSETSLRFTPMLIPVETFQDFEAWERQIKKIQKGARLRLKRRALADGYYVKPFAWKQYIPDIHAINHSMPVRSGGAMRAGYLQSIEKLGGYPQSSTSVSAPKCSQHYNYCFGVFLKDIGRSLGAVRVDERLVAYLTVRRTGEVLLYSRIMGHGDHLDRGIMVLLHHQFIEWLSGPENALARGLRYVMYGGAENGGDGLLQFKSQSGFQRHYVTATSGLAIDKPDDAIGKLRATHARLATGSASWLTGRIANILRRFG
jgi:hypothetical protein